MSGQRAIIVGASSGIGAELVKQLAEQGWKVAAVARREDRLKELAAKAPDRILGYVHDVRNASEAPGLFERITDDLGGLDLIVYASGVMPPVGPSEYDFDKDRDVIETNLLGAMAWLNLASIRFEGTKSGSIIGIGSVAGDRGRSGQPAYYTSKAALHTYLESIRNRISRYGVAVVTVKPGPVRTEMTAGLNMAGMMEAEEAARRILKLRNRTGEHYLAFSHRVMFFIIRNFPSPIFRRLRV